MIYCYLRLVKSIMHLSCLIVFSAVGADIQAVTMLVPVSSTDGCTKEYFIANDRAKLNLL